MATRNHWRKSSSSTYCTTATGRGDLGEAANRIAFMDFSDRGTSKFTEVPGTKG